MRSSFFKFGAVLLLVCAVLSLNFLPVQSPGVYSEVDAEGTETSLINTNAGFIPSEKAFTPAALLIGVFVVAQHTPALGRRILGDSGVEGVTSSAMNDLD
jgi:hypothetical protein